jgi:hypothetical protein
MTYIYCKRANSLRGKPETGINASVIYPQLIIRFPYAAPFEFCLCLVVGRVVPNPPFADRATNLPRHPILSIPNGGLGESRPTSCFSPMH